MSADRILTMYFQSFYEIIDLIVFNFYFNIIMHLLVCKSNIYKMYINMCVRRHVGLCVLTYVFIHVCMYALVHLHLYKNLVCSLFIIVVYARSLINNVG